jgi:hypothetical protein
MACAAKSPKAGTCTGEKPDKNPEQKYARDHLEKLNTPTRRIILAETMARIASKGQQFQSNPTQRTKDLFQKKVPDDPPQNPKDGRKD